MQLNYPPLSQVTDEYVNTDAAAHYLNRKAGTLLAWACGRRKSPITPRRVKGRLLWSVAEIRTLVTGSAS